MVFEGYQGGMHPSSFQRVLQLLPVYKPEDQFDQVSGMLLQDLMTHFDPMRQGMLLSILQCTPPAGSGPVRSLYMRTASGTPPWTGDIVQQKKFFGAESLACHAIMTDHAEIIFDTSDPRERLPFVHLDGARSLLCCPIKRFGRWAGALAAATTFQLSRANIPLFQEAAMLLGLVVAEQELYALQSIDFKMMPPPQKQLPLLAVHQQRLLTLVTQARQNGQTLSLAEAERIMLQLFENELLAMGG